MIRAFMTGYSKALGTPLNPWRGTARRGSPGFGDGRSSVMTPGHFTLEDVTRTAVGAYRLAAMQDVEKYTRMLAPQGRGGRRAVQRQVVSGYFDGEFVGHDAFPVGVGISEK